MRKTMSTWDTTPKTDFITALASQKWSAQGAISELVDNSLGKIRGNARHVTIIHDRTSRIHKLTVFDDGQGMDHIGRLFQLAEGIGRGIEDIGKYGSGGTMGLMWLASEVFIATLRNGNIMKDRIRWADYIGEAEWPKVNDTWEPAGVRNTPTTLWEAKHGTYIEMKINESRTINSDVVQRELAKTYAPGLRQGRRIKWITITKGRVYEQTLHGELFELPDDRKRIVNFNIVVTIGDKHLPAKGTVALVDGLSFSDSFISIGYGPRVIFNTRACYESQDGSRKYSGTGVGGWIDLGEGWQDEFTVTKDELRNDRVRTVLMHHIFTKIEPLLKQTEEDQLSVVLDGIALDLSEALSNLNTKLDLDAGFGDMPARLRFNDDGIANPEPFKPFAFTPKVVENDPNRLGPHDADKNKVPPVSEIKLHPSSDEEMNGGLCQLNIVSDNDKSLRVQINKEHDVVKEILKARHMNRVALILMVTREIAGELVHRPAMLSRVLAPKIRRVIEAIEDDRQRERKLARMFMDAARLPNSAA
jgi:hypothetical protein